MIFHVKNQCRYILFYGVGLSINFPIKLTIKFTIKFYRHVWVVGGVYLHLGKIGLVFLPGGFFPIFSSCLILLASL